MTGKRFFIRKTAKQMAKRKSRPYVPEPPDYKIFNRKLYKYNRWHWTEKAALKEVLRLRKEGYFARVVIVDPGAATYKRQRSEAPRRQVPISRKTPRITPKVGRLK